MSDKTLPTGAYVIRNKKHNKVLHITEANIVTATESSVERQDRDENTYPEQQIWWVERVPEYEDSEDPIYSITNPASGKSLIPTESRGLLVSQSNGKLSQKWRLRQPSSGLLEEGRIYLNILNYARVYSIDGDYVGQPGGKPMYDAAITDSAQCWEFIEPQTKFPSGWVEISNMEGGRILNHTYLTSPPHLIHPPKQDKDYKLPMYRERWGTQWTISRYSSHCSASGDESWIIKNRLTGGRLSLSDSPEGVTTEQGDAPVTAQEGWVLEFRGGETAWRIRSKGSSCYLEQTIEKFGSGTKVVCTDKNYLRWPMDKSKKWLFRMVGDHKCE